MVTSQAGVPPAVRAVSTHAQDRLKSMPGYERHREMTRTLTNAIKLGSLSVTWATNGESFEYRRGDKRFRYDIASHRTVDITPMATNAPDQTKANAAVKRFVRRLEQRLRAAGFDARRGQQFAGAQTARTW